MEKIELYESEVSGIVERVKDRLNEKDFLNDVIVEALTNGEVTEETLKQLKDLIEEVSFQEEENYIEKLEEEKFNALADYEYEKYKEGVL